MSFSGSVKKEVAKVIAEDEGGQLAELSAIVSMCGHVKISEHNDYSLSLRTESAAVARKSYTLLKEGFGIKTHIEVKKQLHKKHHLYQVLLDNHHQTYEVLQKLMILDQDGQVEENLPAISRELLRKEGWKRTYIRGAFLAAGSISDPKKAYHLEIVCHSKAKAVMLRALINSFGLSGKLVCRKKHYVVYFKEGAQIVDILGIMEAHEGLMDLENVRIIKDVRNSVNRKVNCETANINKTVSAAMKQIEDIHLIEESVGLNKLEPGLEELARIRLENQEASLKELGELLTEPVGKSGVNHRLRKLSEMADKIKANQEA